MATPVPPPLSPAALDPEERRDLGAFYTPLHTTEHMAELLRGLTPDSRVLEPSGGDGAFVMALLACTDLRPDQVEVWDLDDTVAPALAEYGVMFENRDALLDAPAPGERTFTHAIGNPPYLNKQSAYVRANRADLGRVYKPIGANDTYAMFIHMAIERLTLGGQLVFLVSDTFLTLGIHRKLREYLLANTEITSITLMPAGTFPDAAVKTAILNVTRRPARDGHTVEVIDLRAQEPGDYTGGIRHHVPQAEFAGNPTSVFAYDPQQRQALQLVAGLPPLMSLLDGGLGMHTGDNRTYLGVISRDGVTAVKPPRGMAVVDAAKVDSVAWRPYHKRGGSARWWAPAEHCVRWDELSVAQYGIPATALVGELPGGTRDGFIVSGVAATLTARLMTPGALWESNKAFGLFPRDPGTYPVTFFLAVLNSTFYNTLARALNHTVSFQARDLAALPLLPFTTKEVTELASLGQQAVEATAGGQRVPVEVLARIETVVAAAADRAPETVENADEGTDNAPAAAA